MVWGIFRKGRKVGKVHWTKNSRVWSMYLKPEVAEMIRQLRHWKKRGFASRLAEQTGFTRQMMSAVLRQSESCSVDVAMAIAEVAGVRPNAGDCWCYMFECRLREMDSNSQMFNNDKYSGKRPYEAVSLSADFREKDKEIERHPLTNTQTSGTL